jgi:glycosyltransferase involved in cell wall biosynthesis
VEVILVDNGSFDETPRAVERLAYPNLHYHRMPKNLGFAKACNFGAQKAAGDLLLFLNNDMAVLPGSIRSLSDTLKGNPSVGIAGARLLYANYTIQHAGMALDDAYDLHHVYRHYPAEHPLVLVKRAFQAVTGACLMISRSLFSEMDGFDETYLNSHEDVDLCLRVRASGREVVYDPAAVFFHYESMSAGRTLASRRGTEVFLGKWRGRLGPDLTEKTTVFASRLAATFDAEMRTILESANSPYRSTPYASWPQSEPARRYRELAMALALCEASLRPAAGSSALEKELNDLKKWVSYKLARALTWLPRKLRALLRPRP